MDETTTKQYEEGLIGALLTDTSGYAMELCEKRGVEADWFASPEAQAIWPIFVKQWRTNKALDGFSAADATGIPGAIQWLMTCTQKGTLLQYVAGYLEKIGEARAYRRICAFATQLQVEAKSIGAQAALARAEMNMTALRDECDAQHEQFVRVEDVADQLMQEYETLYQKRVVEGDKTYYNGLRLPWDVLNSVYTGVKPGIHVIGARPSNGKTSLTIGLSSGMAFFGTKQLIFSRDMKVDQFVARYGAFHGLVSLRTLNNGGTA